MIWKVVRVFMLEIIVKFVYGLGGVVVIVDEIILGWSNYLYFFVIVGMV